MTGLLQLNFGAGALVRGDLRLKRVRHGGLSVAVEEADGVGLLVNLSGGHRVEGRLEGSFLTSSPRPASVTVIPPSCPCEFRISGTCSVLMLRLDWTHILDAAARADLDPASFKLQPRINAADPVLARRVFDAAACGTPDAYDAALEGVAEHLVVPAGLVATRRRSIGLAGATLRRVLEFCRDRSPGLSELAQEAGLSKYHFARSFKLATGASPISYLLRCRTERALDTLARTDLPVGAVARDSGFSHASHLAGHVRRATGLSPEQYRRRILS